MPGSVGPVASARACGQIGAGGFIGLRVDLSTDPYFQCSASASSEWACSTLLNLRLPRLPWEKGIHLAVQGPERWGRCSSSPLFRFSINLTTFGSTTQHRLLNTLVSPVPKPFWGSLQHTNLSYQSPFFQSPKYRIALLSLLSLRLLFLWISGQLLNFHFFSLSLWAGIQVLWMVMCLERLQLKQTSCYVFTENSCTHGVSSLK